MTALSPGLELRGLREAVSRSRDSLLAGAAIDLDGLDTEVARILANVCAAPAEERRALVVEIEALLGELDALASALKHQHGAASAPHARKAYDAN